MTSIAWDGKTLAVDSRASSGNSLSSNAVRKIWDLRYQDVCIHQDKALAIALCGSISLMKNYVDALIANDLEKLIQTIPQGRNYNIGGLIIGEEFVYEFSDHYPNYCIWPHYEPVALGSGEPYCRSAMALGLSAGDAVRHAMQFDLATGGIVYEIKL